MNNLILAKAFVSNKHLDLNLFQGEAKFGRLLRKEPSFLLFELKPDAFLYIKNYGGIVHFNLSSEDAEMVNKLINTLSDSTFTEFEESINVRINPEEKINADYDTLVIPELNLNFVHIICLNLSQSSALFHYQSLSDKLLNDTKKYTIQLEQFGRVSLRRKALMKFIGTTLNLKNQIAEHLYIFETPTLAWDDPKLNSVDNILNEDLEIKLRYNAIKEQLNLVKENLDHFKDINLHQHSSLLEWIIILLILFEVIHVLLEKLL